MASPAGTALITGASGGIGAAMARLLASRGFDLVLAARSAERLGALAAELRGPRIEILPVDLALPSAPAQIRTSLEEKAIAVDVLINNAGYGSFGPFAESDPETELGQIQVNVTALTHLTRLLLPGLLARKRGRILNVASTAAFQPGPMMAVYYACKAYVLSFSEALANEVKGTGVTVSCLCPGPTRTGFMARAKMGNAEALSRKSVLMDADAVARKGIDGMLKGKRLIIPGFLNRMLAHSTRFGSRGLSASVVRRIMEEIRATGEAPPP